MEDAIRHVIERRGFKAGDHTVGYQSCDASTPQTGGFEFRKCAANASAYAHAEQLVAVIGPYSSFCGQVQIPITNRAPGGPLAMVSAISTHPGLTRGGPINEAGGLRGEPAVYYPTGKRSFVRLMAREDLQGVANAMLAKELGLRRVYVLQEPELEGRAGRSVPAHGSPARDPDRGRCELQRRLGPRSPGRAGGALRCARRVHRRSGIGGRRPRGDGPP